MTMSNAVNGQTNGQAHAAGAADGTVQLTDEEMRAKLPAEGQYITRAVAWRWIRFEKGSKAHEVSFRVPGPKAGGGEELQFVLAQLHFSDKTRERSIQSLRYMGWTGTDPKELKDPKSGVLAKNDVVVTVEHESYVNDKGVKSWKARVAWINRVGGSMFETANDEDIDGAFGNMFKTVAASIDESGHKKRASGAGSKPQETSLDSDSGGAMGGDDVPSDEEIPF